MEEEKIANARSDREGIQTCDPVKVEEYSGIKREGYKKSKLGWIPEEWEVKSLDDIGDFSKGKGISKVEITSSGKPCIRYAEIYTKYDFYTDHLESYISEESALNSREIFYGDLLFAGSGETLEDIGKCVAYLGKENAFAGGDIVILSPKKEDPMYLGFLLNHAVANGQKHKLGQGHSVVHIYSSGLKKLKVPLPPIKEQQKIATILSTWDRAIAKQEQLITAKQEYKKGLMQLLLTGKKRFEGFEGEWETPMINTVFDFLNTNSLSRNQLNYDDVEGVYNIHYGDIHATYEDSILNFDYENKVPKINKDVLLSKNVDYLKSGDLIIADASEDYEGIGEAIELANVNEREVVSGLHTFAFRDKKNKTAEGFRSYIFRNPVVKKALKTIATGSKVYGISKGNIQKFRIVLPTLPEQQKIAALLSAVDKEIGLLQSELAELREQKRGLMQRLLTGEVRVKIN